MKLDLHALLKRGKRFNEGTIEEFSEILREFNESLCSIIDSLAHAKVHLKPWQRNLDPLMVKFTLHVYSLFTLSQGLYLSHVKEISNLKYYDLSSIRLIIRAIIENYLTLHYLSSFSKSDEETEFRNDLYELGGLSRRQEFDAQTSFSLGRKKQEMTDIESLKEKIKKNLYFKSLSEKEQKTILNSKPIHAKTIGWENLIENSELNTTFFKQIWKLYSNYAHSEFISAVQLRDYFKDNSELKKTISFDLKMACTLVAVLITDLLITFKITRLIYNTFPEKIIMDIEFFSLIGKGKSKSPF